MAPWNGPNNENFTVFAFHLCTTLKRGFPIKKMKYPNPTFILYAGIPQRISEYRNVDVRINSGDDPSTLCTNLVRFSLRDARGHNVRLYNFCDESVKTL